MNTSQLKSYAPAARRAFIAAVSAQAARVGITADGVAPGVVRGDILLIDGRAMPKALVAPRDRLVKQIEARSFDAVMETHAYSWFNRLVAIRYMELHGYLDHGYRVLSHPEGPGQPEILDHAADVELPGLDRAKAIELKLAGDEDEALYRLLLEAQCNALHQAMPFLFEPIGDETELLLPANLLHTDSVIRRLVDDIDEELWQDIEIIGWIYQFYISEKKDQVIGKVVASEDIPAATQLFTPNWIVKYMVQNSLGAQWLATYPDSPLKGTMEYYIVPAEQTDEVNAQLAAITPKALDPEALTLIDPACGSGHILVEAYELFRAIYLERGYRQRDVAQLILEKNLFGLDIDERAAQLTGFALMMKGRGDDRRLFERGVKLNVMALVDSAGFDADRLIAEFLSSERVELVPSNDLFPETLSQRGLTVTAEGSNSDAETLRNLVALFEHATAFGSLIQVPEGLAEKLPALKRLGETARQHLFVSQALKRLELLVRQAELLSTEYDAVVANPPYIGSKFHTPILKKFLRDHYEDYKKDVFSAFIDRNLVFSRPNGRLGFMSPFVWMFISSYEHLRTRLINAEAITSLVQLEYSGFEGATVPICTFTVQEGHVNGRGGCYVRLSDFRGPENQAPKTLEAISNRNCGWFFEAAQDEFKYIPGSPIAYWASKADRTAFMNGIGLARVAQPRSGMSTGNAEAFIYYWWEVPGNHLGLDEDERAPQRRFYPHNKAGGGRRWFGYAYYVLKYGDLDLAKMEASAGFRHDNRERYFQPSISWGKITSAQFSARSYPAGFTFDNAAVSLFEGQGEHLVGMLNSSAFRHLVSFLCPTLNFTVGDVSVAPVPDRTPDARPAQELVSTHRDDWNAYERSWDFQSLPMLAASSEPTRTLECSYTSWITQNRTTIAEMKRLEEENNRLFIDAYGLQDELTPDVPIEQITLTVNPAYRYGMKLTEDEQWTRFRADTMEELVSYAIGCMMGRYSLDAPGLIYADSGNEGFDHDKYTTFPADDDGIVPLTDTAWFDDDACHRLVEFLSVAWDPAHLEDNLTFLANNLSPKKNEASRVTIRRWLCDKFFKFHHLKRYKKRPIYWLFSSGKRKAFQCLVYLHRYNEGTLSRMRSEYVIPLQGKMAGRIERLDEDIEVATSTAQSKRLGKEKAKLENQHLELLTFDEKLRHYADKRISLDLDDGVKVNYGKFGDLLAEVKAVHGKKPVAE